MAKLTAKELTEGELRGSKFDEVKEIFESLGCKVVIVNTPHFYRYTIMNENGGVTKSNEVVSTTVCSANYKRDIGRVVAQYKAREAYLLFAEIASLPSGKFVSYRACLFDDIGIK